MKPDAINVAEGHSPAPIVGIINTKYKPAQCGWMATPYGNIVPLYSMAGGVAVDVDGFARCLGIHDESARRRFAEELEEHGYYLTTREIERLGGHPPPLVNLPDPEERLCPHGAGTIMAYDDEGIMMQWVARFACPASWHRQVAQLLEDLDVWLAEHPAVTRADAGLIATAVITAALENTGAQAINNIAFAAICLLSAHSEWRNAAATVMQPFVHTWAADWVKSHPAFQRIAALVGEVYEVPSWAKEVL